MKELDDDTKVDIDEYVEAWCMDPAMTRYFRLSRERGIEIVDVPEQYL